MDVQCERCRTEYDLNDALVSARGTAVRCTTCGHLFRVHPVHQSAAPEQWVVRTEEGRSFAFATFRELQSAILAKQVLREDTLLRDGAPPQPLHSIAELEPLFERGGPSALIGLAVSEPRSQRPSAPLPSAGGSPRSFEGGPPSGRPSMRPSLHPTSAAPPSVPSRGKIDTLRPPGGNAAAPPPAPHSAPRGLASDDDDSAEHDAQTALAAGLAPDPWEADESVPPMKSSSRPRSPSPMPVAGLVGRPVWRARLPSDDELPELRSLAPSSEEPYSSAPRRRVGGWIVALALLLAVGAIGWAAIKPYLTAREAGAAVQLNPRAQAFLADGEKTMADGDLDVAQENFDKASALAEDDARVLLDQARLAAAKADVPWLKLRLLPSDAADETRTTRAQLDELVTRAQRAAGRAYTSAPSDLAALRAEIDALRLSGDRDAARSYVARVIGQASQPETAYVLAALDLAEPEPLWATVIERLRLAAAGEGDAGRARAALVYALSRSGDRNAARAELAKMDALRRPYPLLPNLHAFVGSAPSKPATADVAAAPSTRSPEPSAPTAARVPGSFVAPVDPGGSGDPRVAMQLALAAIKKGDFARAGQLYQGVVAKNPSDSEALAGLGDVARLNGDSAGAVADYKRAIAVNPSYLPALLGLADTQWAGGDKAGAIRAYSDIVDRFPEGTYPAYVAKRVANAAAAAPTTNESAPPAATGGRPE